MGDVADGARGVSADTRLDAAAGARFGRRSALKGLAGAAAASLVWAEPTIKGLARRPAYATSGSGSISGTTGAFEIVMPPFDIFGPFTALTTIPASDGSTTIEVYLVGPFDFFLPGTEAYVVVGGTDDPACECVTSAAVGLQIEGSDGITYDSPPAGGFIGDFALPIGVTPALLRWTSLTITCL